jgi:hypothetical protein
MTLGFDEQAFLYDALMFLKRTFNPVHMITVSIRHRSDNFVIAGSRVTKKHIRDAGDHVTRAELMHSPTPTGSTICCAFLFSLRSKGLQRLRQKKGINRPFC